MNEITGSINQSSSRSPRSPTAKKVLMPAAIKYIAETYAGMQDVKEWWKSKGYKEQAARKLAQQTFNEIVLKANNELPSLKEKHSAIYKFIIEKCIKNGNGKLLLDAMERLENLHNIGGHQQQLNVNISTNVPQQLLDRARQFLLQDKQNAARMLPDTAIEVEATPVTTSFENKICVESSGSANIQSS